MFLNSHQQGLNKLVFVPRFLSARGFTTWPSGPASSQRAGMGEKMPRAKDRYHADAGERRKLGKLREVMVTNHFPCSAIT